jgi:hypothetical protein
MCHHTCAHIYALGEPAFSVIHITPQRDELKEFAPNECKRGHEIRNQQYAKEEI